MPRRSSSLHSIDDLIQRNISNDKYQDVVTVGQNIDNVVIAGQNIDAIIAAPAAANAAQVAAALAENAKDVAIAARDTATQAANDSGVSAEDALLASYIATAKEMTATSYAEENEDIPVVIYTSNGDGTYTGTPTNPAQYSAKHWKIKAEALVSTIDTANVLNTHVIGNTTNEHLDTMLNISHSSGVTLGCDLTDNGNGTVNIAAGEALIRSTPDELATIYSVEVPAVTNLAITTGATNYLYIDYNAGSPTWAVTLNQTDINCIDKCLAYIVFRTSSGQLDVIDDRGHSIDVSRKTRALFRSFGRFIHVEDGSVLYNPSGLTIGVTAGAFFYTVTRIDHPAYDTSIAGTANENVFEYFYRDGLGSWVGTYDQKVVDNTYYDDGTGTLALIGNAKFGVHWVYIINNDPSRLAVVYGQQSYNTLAAAENATPPVGVPPIIDGLGVLAGFVIVQDGNATIVNTLSAFDRLFSSSQATSHNGLAGLQGGAINEYYHLTAAEYADLAVVKQPISEKGQANGYTPLNGVGQIDAQYLPSYVDDVIEVATYADLPVTGEAGKIYIVVVDETSGDNTSTYRWTGTVYAQVSDTMTANDILALLITVDGSGSGLDADTIDGLDSTAFEPADATILKDADIGVTVQGYDIDTVKRDLANTFSAAQRTSYSTEDNSIDFATNNDFKITLGSSLVVTVGNVVGCSGQSGIIIISDIENISGWSGFTWLGSTPTMTTGVGVFGYKIDGTTVYIVKVENV